VVHGEGGLDEISLSGATKVSQLKEGVVQDYTLRPEELGFSLVPLEAVRGGDAAQNAELLEGILRGKAGPGAEMVILNAAGALVAAGLAWEEAVSAARRSLESGAALAKLAALIKACREPAP
jgi:anthranilate phosphoribosyltransferase